MAGPNLNRCWLAEPRPISSSSLNGNVCLCCCGEFCLSQATGSIRPGRPEREPPGRWVLVVLKYKLAFQRSQAALLQGFWALILLKNSCS
jgi:hypothetical protein